MARKKKIEPDLTVYNDERLTSKFDKESSKWPKVVKGTHLTVTTYKNGSVKLDWDYDALTKEIQDAIMTYETNKVTSKPKTTRRKKIPNG